MTVDALSYLSELEFFGMKLGLDNMRALVEALGHPERTFKSIHIAGTNGKGSVTAMTEAALRSSGYRAARYTSPHIVDVTERFVIDGKAVERERLEAAIEDLRTVVDRLLARGTLQYRPTFFEAMTALAFELFRRARVEVAVCEVGLGGRLDATNVLDPVATAITTIGLDHEEHLGTTLTAIAHEKAGIIKPGVPVVVGRMPAEAAEEIERTASERGAQVVRAWEGTSVQGTGLDIGGSGPTPVFEHTRHGPGTDLRTVQGDPSPVQRFRLVTPVRDYGEVELALAGEHQVANAMVAVRLLETLDRALPVRPDAISAGLANVTWPGRIERRELADGRSVILDAAHNPDGAAALAGFLRSGGEGPYPIVFAASRDKDTTGMIRALAGVASAFVFTRASSKRGAEPEDLARKAQEAAPDVTVRVVPVPREAIATAWQMSKRIVVAGSIFLLGDLMKDLQ